MRTPPGTSTTARRRGGASARGADGARRRDVGGDDALLALATCARATANASNKRLLVQRVATATRASVAQFFGDADVALERLSKHELDVFIETAFDDVREKFHVHGHAHGDSKWTRVNVSKELKFDRLKGARRDRDHKTVAAQLCAMRGQAPDGRLFVLELGCGTKQFDAFVEASCALGRSESLLSPSILTNQDSLRGWRTLDNGDTGCRDALIRFAKRIRTFQISTTCTLVHSAPSCHVPNQLAFGRLAKRSSLCYTA